MSEKEKEIEIIEFFDGEEAIKSLKDLSSQLKTEQKKVVKEFAPGEIIPQEEIVDQEEKLKSMEKQYSLIFGSIFRFINPVLKRWKIDTLTNDEIDNLGRAVLNLTERKVKSTVEKMEKRFRSLINLPKYIDAIAVIWEILFPRVSQFRATQKAILERGFKG